MKKFFGIVFSILLVAILASCNNGAGSIIEKDYSDYLEDTTSYPLKNGYQTQTVSMQKNKDFNIIVLTDIHIDAAQKTKENVFDILRPILNNNEFDMIAILGDNMSGTKEADYKLLVELTQIIDSYEKPWAIVFGNHDRDYSGGMEKMADLFESYENCLFQKFPMYADEFKTYENLSRRTDSELSKYEKYGNYAVSLQSGKDTVYSLVFMDSGPLGGHIESYQLEWYEKHIQKLSQTQYGEFNPIRKKVVPSILFNHIGIPEHNEWAGIFLQKQTGEGKVPADFGYGENRETPRSLQAQLEQFKTAKSLGCTDIYAGHNHDNNSTFTYDGMSLSYANKTGYNSSGSKATATDYSYAKMITIDSKTFTTSSKFVYST